LCTGTALSALNSGMIAVALATIRRDFTLDIATVTWVITSYYLASAALQPLMGRLADRYGPRRLFTFGMAVIVLTGALTPFAPSFWRTQMVDTGTAAIGPVVGGVLVTNFGWEAIFWINIPLAAISLIGVLLLAPADAVNAKEPLRRTIIDFQASLRSAPPSSPC
jgi:MFS family permease